MGNAVPAIMKNGALCLGSPSAAGLAKGHYMDLANAGLDTIPGSGEQDSGGITEDVPVTLPDVLCHVLSVNEDRKQAMDVLLKLIIAF